MFVGNKEMRDESRGSYSLFGQNQGEVKLNPPFLSVTEGRYRSKVIISDTMLSLDLVVDIVSGQTLSSRTDTGVLQELFSSFF